MCVSVCLCLISILPAYLINFAAAGHSGMTQRNLGNSRFQWSHFHSASSLQTLNLCGALPVPSSEKCGWYCPESAPWHRHCSVNAFSLVPISQSRLKNTHLNYTLEYTTQCSIYAEWKVARSWRTDFLMSHDCSLQVILPFVQQQSFIISL